MTTMNPAANHERDAILASDLARSLFDWLSRVYPAFLAPAAAQTNRREEAD